MVMRKRKLLSLFRDNSIRAKRLREFVWHILNLLNVTLKVLISLIDLAVLILRIFQQI